MERKSTGIEMTKKKREKNRKMADAKMFAQDLRGYIRGYCEVSSIQGLANTLHTTTLVERIWWVGVFMFGIAGSCFMVYRILNKFFTTPVLVALATKESTINAIPFPAVTICPEAKISSSCLNYTGILKARKGNTTVEYEINQNVMFDYMAALCRQENHQGASSSMPQTIEYAEFFDECKAVKLENSYCAWMGKMKNCSEILTPILTSQGLCYSFNMYDVRDIYTDLNTMKYYDKQSNRRQDWDPEKGFSDATDLRNMYPKRAILNGAKSALVVVLLTDREDINYACRDFSIQGMRVSLHNPASIPRLGQVFFSVGLDRLTTVAVLPTVTSTSDKIREYSPEKRGCFFDHERELKYFKYYSQSSCNIECWTNYTINECGCVAFHMPRDNNTKDCTPRQGSCIEEARIGYTEDILRQRLNKQNPANARVDCNCMPLCAEITYNGEISSVDWNFNDNDDVQFDDDRQEMSRYRASAIKIFYKNRYFLPTERDELYGTSEMISNIGGALGLFTGFTLVTLAEIIYYLSIKLIDNYRRHHHWAGPRVQVAS